MQTFSQKYTIVCLLEDRVAGHAFDSTNWPLHITLAGTFATDLSPQEVSRQLAIVASQATSLKSELIDDAYFGESGQVYVLLVDPVSKLKQLHERIITSLEPGNIVFNDPQFTKEGFVPHVTIGKNESLLIGDSVLVRNVALIDMFPDEDPHKRKILALHAFNEVTSN